MSRSVLVLYPGQNYVKALESVGLQPVYDANVLTDGLVLTGGGDLSPSIYNEPNYASTEVFAERDLRELTVLKKYVEKNLPVLGICRGLQVTNVFFGGTLLQDVKFHDRLNGNDRLHEIYTVKGSVMRNLYGEKIVVNSAHHQAVKIIGSPLKLGAFSRDGIIESLEYDNILLTQFHPERLGTKGLLIFDYFRKLIG